MLVEWATVCFYRHYLLRVPKKPIKTHSNVVFYSTSPRGKHPVVNVVTSCSSSFETCTRHTEEFQTTQQELLLFQFVVLEKPVVNARTLRPFCMRKNTQKALRRPLPLWICPAIVLHRWTSLSRSWRFRKVEGVFRVYEGSYFFKRQQKMKKPKGVFRECFLCCKGFDSQVCWVLPGARPETGLSKKKKKNSLPTGLVCLCCWKETWIQFNAAFACEV